jgi:hypothetical protein
MERMTTLESIRAANASMDAYFSDAAALHGTFGKEERWKALAQIACIIDGLTPLLHTVAHASGDASLQDQIDRYILNLGRFDKECTAALADLSNRRTHLWKEEQALRAKHNWQETF